jgi:hypothetical protein
MADPLTLRLFGPFEALPHGAPLPGVSTARYTDAG